MPAYIGNGRPQFFIFVELAGGDDEKVLESNAAIKTSLSGLADLGLPSSKLGPLYDGGTLVLSRRRCQAEQNVRNQT
jgi:hypothetical protein